MVIMMGSTASPGRHGAGAVTDSLQLDPQAQDTGNGSEF